MQFTVTRSEISEAVINIQRAVSTKTSIPALEGILINALEGTIELSAYDLELGITTVIPATCREQGKTVINAKVFSEIVRKSPADTVTVSVNEKNMVTIVSGQSEFTIIGIPAEEFPEFPKISDSTVIKIQSNVLKSMIRQTLFAIAEGDAKPIHQGSLFNIEDGRLDMVSVDGYRLAKRTEPIKFDENIDFVVPGKTLGEINKLLKDSDDEIELIAGRRHIMFKINNYTIISSLIEGEFLNYKRSIPDSNPIEVLVKTREAIECVERVSLLITDRLKSPLRCTFEGDQVKLLCTTSVGRAQDFLPAKITGGDIEIGFNNRYLLDALKHTESDEVVIRLSTPLSPMIITPKEGDDFLFLVLPVRLKAN